MINCSDRLFLLTLRFSGVTFPIAYIYFFINYIFFIFSLNQLLDFFHQVRLLSPGLHSEPHLRGGIPVEISLWRTRLENLLCVIALRPMDQTGIFLHNILNFFFIYSLIPAMIESSSYSVSAFLVLNFRC